jgi:hypothetical protein
LISKKEEQKMKTPGTGVLIGSAVGALLTIALIAVFYAG